MKRLIFTTQKFKTIQRVLENNQSAFEGKIQAIEARQNFTDNAAEMSTLITDLTVPLTSVYLNRKKARETLILDLGKMLQIGIMFASRIGDDVLLNTLKDFKRRYGSVSANEMIQFANYFMGKISDQMEKAAEVGITEEDISAFREKTNAYLEAAEAVSNLLGDRRARRERLNNLIQTGNKLLLNDLDRFVIYNAEAFSDLNFAYNRVRWSKRRKPSGQSLPANSDISGTITDFTTAIPLEGATLSLIEHANAITSDKDGYFLFDDLEEGEYTVTCHATGYEVPEPFVVTLTAGESVVHNFALKSVAV